jgi:hypothetical protein
MVKIKLNDCPEKIDKLLTRNISFTIEMYPVIKGEDGKKKVGAADLVVDIGYVKETGYRVIYENGELIHIEVNIDDYLHFLKKRIREAIEDQEDPAIVWLFPQTRNVFDLKKQKKDGFGPAIVPFHYGGKIYKIMAFQDTPHPKINLFLQNGNRIVSIGDDFGIKTELYGTYYYRDFVHQVSFEANTECLIHNQLKSSIQKVISEDFLEKMGYDLTDFEKDIDTVQDLLNFMEILGFEAKKHFLDLGPKKEPKFRYILNHTDFICEVSFDSNVDNIREGVTYRIDDTSCEEFTEFLRRLEIDLHSKQKRL